MTTLDQNDSRVYYQRALGAAGFRTNAHNQTPWGFYMVHPAGGRAFFRKADLGGGVFAVVGGQRIALPDDEHGEAAGLIHGIRRRLGETADSSLWRDGWAWAVLAAHGRATEGTGWVC